MSILDNIKESIRLLEDFDSAFDELSAQISLADRKIDYWLHKIEFETIPVTQAYKILKEMKHQRNLRRRYKNELEILKVFRDNEGKMCNAGNRKILLTQVCKTDNKQQNAKYSYDAYTEEEINEILDIQVKESL